MKHAIKESDLHDLPQRKVELNVDQAQKVYEGVSLADVLKHFGVGFGEELKGGRTPTVVLCEASDRYRVAIALVEIDPATTDKVVLLAYRCDGRALPDEEGPFRFIISDEKRRLRSIRMLKTIRIANLRNMPMTQTFEPAAEPAE